ncbi:MAG: ATP-binding protein [Lachnospiraceae bacterium]|nr:ATP-binding protein [Lachnospiraceae bacterium]
MILRKAEKEIERFFEDNQNKALLVTGARQTGKTFSIRRVAAGINPGFVELNFLENKDARELFSAAHDSREILLSISALSQKDLIPGETIIFLDEVQECKEILTVIKFLVEEGSYRYILSGSLLGVEMNAIRSLPVGYMGIIEMFPLDFEEFCRANGVSEAVLAHVFECFSAKSPVTETVHEKMMQLFWLYLIVGGMPEAVRIYLETNNLRRVSQTQEYICELYKQDIAKYDPDRKLYLAEIFSLIPGELNSQNKRFIMKKLNERAIFSRYENSFLWLKDAGVALPTYCVDEPKSPLILSRATNLFKLFASDVGLLASMYADGIQVQILKHEKDINFGAIFENAVAQELHCHGFALYYYRSKKMGELDFVIEKKGQVIPLEIKSGKSYKRHSAMTAAIEKYNFPEAYVFCTDRLSTDGVVTYFPIYMIMCLEKEKAEDIIYRIDLEGLE